jgi:hypothetical protein
MAHGFGLLWFYTWIDGHKGRAVAHRDECMTIMMTQLMMAVRCEDEDLG